MTVLKRLDQALSNLGYCSRREVRYWIRDKRIRINGELAKNASQKVDPNSLLVDHQPLDHPGDILIMLNKPLDYVCSHDINEGQRIYDLLSALVQQLTSPKQHVDKVYIVNVEKALDNDIIEQFAAGVQLISETEPCLPAKLEIIDTQTAKVTLNEGKYHQVRRMFAACGNHVVSLHREQFGQYSLGDLAPGEWRDLI